jgi:hypothetical protein
MHNDRRIGMEGIPFIRMLFQQGYKAYKVLVTFTLACLPCNSKVCDGCHRLVERKNPTSPFPMPSQAQQTYKTECFSCIGIVDGKRIGGLQLLP